MSQTLAPKPDHPEHVERALRDTAGSGGTQPRSLKRIQALGERSSNPGALDAKTKALIALAIIVADRCEGCIAAHTRDALEAGASRQEISDALGVAVLMGGSPSMLCAGRTIDALEQYENRA